MGFFNRDQYLQGITMAVGTVIVGAFAFPDSVSKVFTAISPALCFVGWAFSCPLYSGFSIVLFPILLIGLIFSWCNYYLVLFITYAIVGPDFAPSTEKGVTMVIIATVIVALLQLIRVRFPAFNFPALIAQVLPNVFNFTLSYYSSKAPQMQSNWQFVVLFFIPAGLGVILSFFIIPNPAGRRANELLGSLLSTTQALQNEVNQKLLQGEIDKETNKLKVAAPALTTTFSSAVGATTPNTTTTIEEGNIPQEGRYVGIAEELEPLVVPIHKLDIQAWQIGMGLNGLILLSSLEVNVYKKPHIFPKKAFNAVLTPIRTVERLFLSIASFLEGGRTPMRGFPLLKNELEEVRAAVEMGCSKMKEVILNDYKYETALMECAPRVEAACVALKSKMDQNEKNSGGGDVSASAEDLLVARELGSLVVLAGKELRLAWQRLPALIAAHQPEAGAAAETYFSANKSALGDAPEVTNNSNGNSKSNLGQTLPQAADKAAVVPSPPATSPPEFRKVINLTPSCSSLRLNLYKLSLITGVHRWHLKMVLHMTSVFLVAAILCVTPTANKALGEHAYWIIINLIATSEDTTMGMRDAAWQRIVGTAIGSVGVCATAGFGYLANGSSYVGHNVASRVVQTIFTAIWMGTFKLFHAKYSPRLHRLFIVSIVLPPLIALLDSQGADVWPNIEWRLANTCIGIGLHIFFSFFIHVSAEDHIKEKTSDCVLHIAEMLDEITTLPMEIAPTAVGVSTTNDDASIAAKAIISAGILKADKSLVEIMTARDIVAREYFVSKLQYNCLNGSSPSLSTEDISLPLDRRSEIQPQQPIGGLNKLLKSKAPLRAYQLDQLISHLKRNIVYSNVALSVREWLRSQSLFTTRPEVAVAVRAFTEQTSACFKALRMAIKGLVTPKEAVETVVNLRTMASDISIMCNSSEHFGTEEATIIHTMLMSCRNIEFLFRATDRALVTRDEPGAVSITDQELQGGPTILSMLNLTATTTALQAVAAVDEKKNGAVSAAKDGVKELVGIRNITQI